MQELDVCPNDDVSCDGKHLSMFLMAQNVNLAGNFKIYTEVVLRVKDQLNGKHHEIKCKLITS